MTAMYDLSRELGIWFPLLAWIGVLALVFAIPCYVGGKTRTALCCAMLTLLCCIVAALDACSTWLKGDLVVFERYVSFAWNSVYE